MDEILKFADLLNNFRLVERMSYANGAGRQENDVEHSYQLAMLAWYIAVKENLPLDKDKLLRYGLMHDLVEVYAGDTYLFTNDIGHVNSKAERERQALVRLVKEFPEFPDLATTIHAYEECADEESRFIYALDKLQPLIQAYLDGGRMLRERNITWDMIYEKKKDKVALSPVVQKYFDNLMERLRLEHDKFFNRI